MRSLTLLLLAPFCLAWNAGGADTLVRETGYGTSVDTLIRLAEGSASWKDDGLHVVLNQRSPDGGSAVVGLWFPAYVVHATRRIDLDGDIWVGYTEYAADGELKFQAGSDISGSVRVDADPTRGVQLYLSARLVDDWNPKVWRALEADGFWMPTLGDPDIETESAESGGGVGIGVGGYDDGSASGCDGDDWGSDDDDDWGSSDDGGGCDGDDWGSDDDWGSSDDSGGCEGDDIDTSSEAPSCDCEGDALAGPVGQHRRSRWIMRAFNWAPWCFVVFFIHGMKRRRRR